jgi:hypothetical protein
VEYCASLKNVFSKFFWDNWTENTNRAVANQELSGCLSKGNIEGWRFYLRILTEIFPLRK